MTGEATEPRAAPINPLIARAIDLRRLLDARNPPRPYTAECVQSFRDRVVEALAAERRHVGEIRLFGSLAMWYRGHRHRVPDDIDLMIYDPSVDSAQAHEPRLNRARDVAATGLRHIPVPVLVDVAAIHAVLSTAKPIVTTPTYVRAAGCVFELQTIEDNAADKVCAVRDAVMKGGIVRLQDLHDLYVYATGRLNVSTVAFAVTSKLNRRVNEGYSTVRHVDLPLLVPFRASGDPPGFKRGVLVAEHAPLVDAFNALSKSIAETRLSIFAG